MASIASDSNGRKRIQFVGLDGKRRTLRVGKATKSDAARTARHIENIITAELQRQPIARDTAEWLGDLTDLMHQKLVAVGLVNPRELAAAQLLGSFAENYIRGRVDAKDSSRTVYTRARRLLVEFFGAERQLGTISAGDACEWRLWLIGKKFADTTVRKMCSVARMIFKAAVKRKLIESNPFDDEEIKTAVTGNAARFRFITAEIINEVIEACPNVEWRVIVALSRWGGLRCPSETLSLKWGHVDWERNRLIVPSPKTAHHEGKGERMVPLFPELRVHLEAAFEQAEPGTEYVVNRYRSAAQNLRTTFEKIIRKAGHQPWERLFHNLRATRQTELSDRFPQHVVCGWMGNSQPVAVRHYLHTTDEHFSRAVSEDSTSVNAAQKATQTASELRRIDAHGAPGNEKTPGNQGFTEQSMDDTGLEPVTSTMSR